MSYGSTEYFDWVLSEEEGIKHIKAAYDAGVQTFDTAGVRDKFHVPYSFCELVQQAYSAGLSEIILGKAIKQHNLPRHEIVVMTKVF